MDEPSSLDVPSGVWAAVGVAVGFIVTFWLAFGMMMEFSPGG